MREIVIYDNKSQSEITLKLSQVNGEEKVVGVQMYFYSPRDVSQMFVASRIIQGVSPNNQPLIRANPIVKSISSPPINVSGLPPRQYGEPKPCSGCK
jgi:hypothetical protein